MVSQTRKTIHVTPWILLNFMLPILISSNSDPVSHYTDFVYMKCQNETNIPHVLVSSVLQELVDKSTKSKFYQTSTGDDTIALSGKYQCNHDLVLGDCHDCILNTVKRLKCSSGSLARVQLKGCFISLEPEPEPKSEPEHESGRIDNKSLKLIGVRNGYFQHKKCSERRLGFEGFEGLKDAVFETVAKCVTSSGVGYCETRHEGMYALGQCEGSLGACECGECVSNAFQVAQDECWGSDSGEVYLENCFIGFSDDQPHQVNMIFSGKLHRRVLKDTFNRKGCRRWFRKGSCNGGGRSRCYRSNVDPLLLHKIF